ncbi:MAG: potassium channel family protein [Candidatus Promineifilaceae bacterium]|jgi:voltage-gated potassium channel
MIGNPTRDELKPINYELFILALSVMSLVNWVSYFILDEAPTKQVVLVMDLLLSLVFVVDFIYRFFSARNKANYFVRQFGWLDLLSGLPLPLARIARLARVVRATRLLNAYGLRNTVREFLVNRAGSAVYLVFFLIILVMQYGSIAILYTERGAPEANIRTASDALWWVLVTISTIGYGDRYPVTHQGQLISVVVILLGVALFGVVTGFLASSFDDGDSDEIKYSPVRPWLAPEESLTILEEIARLRQVQEAANAEFNSHLAKLVERLEQVNEAGKDL